MRYYVPRARSCICPDSAPVSGTAAAPSPPSPTQNSKPQRKASRCFSGHVQRVTCHVPLATCQELHMPYQCSSIRNCFGLLLGPRATCQDCVDPCITPLPGDPLGAAGCHVAKRSRPQLLQALKPNSDTLACFCSKTRLTEAALPQTPRAPCSPDLPHGRKDRPCVVAAAAAGAAATHRFQFVEDAKAHRLCHA